ncbi:hypothetical protein SHLI107390_20680 [Shewanella livingstonensis]
MLINKTISENMDKDIQKKLILSTSIPLTTKLNFNSIRIKKTE